MLVLSRKKDETIVVGVGDDEIIVTVLSVHAGRVKLGFAGDRRVQIRRMEVPEPVVEEVVPR